ncbi:MAG: hypothetical protein H0Z29_03590 [Candidatus Marinimicrobia bacterium]|nr:hypothetical protein [Candidatus Neomarinimicrobiota bacterium]
MKKKLNILMILPLVISIIETDIYSYEHNNLITGFFDIKTAYKFNQKKSEEFNIGSLEIDFEGRFSSSLSYEAAIVYQGELLSLGQTIAKFNIFKEYMAIQIGNFDVPFGIDWKYYSTPDRFFISQPVTTDSLLNGGWTETGINFTGKAKYLEYQIFIVNKSPLKECVYGLPDSRKTLGGRLSFNFAKFINIGYSIVITEYSNKPLTGYEFSSSSNNYKIQFEFLHTEMEKAFHLDVIKKIGSLYSAGIRYNSYTLSGNNSQKVDLLSKIDMKDNMSIKLEYQIIYNKLSNYNQLACQIVVSF